MSYTIDVYRNESKYIRNFLDFACFVSMFPQLVAGPIIRFKEIAAQLTLRTHTVEKFARGVAFFILGMAKKVLIANPCGKIADTAFAASPANVVDSWYGAVAYSFQIYFDFSGYSDMAIGLGLMFGFVFAKNFDSPYKSASITDFWRRWHISLSTWLREYLYIPLGGNRKGSRLRTAINIAIVMLLGGLWHGASWNFLIWGAVHGVYLGSERILGKRPIYAAFPAPVRIVLTFGLVTIAWVFFRAENLTQALSYLQSMFGFSSPPETTQLLGALLYTPYNLSIMVVGGFLAWFCPQSWDWTRRLGPGKLFILAILMVLSITILSVQSYNPFIYFNF